MRKTKITALIMVIILVIPMMCINAFGDVLPTFSVGITEAEAGAEVKVPITLSGNSTGICGATLTVTYDEKLTLLSVERGTALTSLNMTKPGDMANNPVNILWDGMEPDTSNGVIAYLIFTAPEENGTYPITLSYIDGDVLGEDVLPIDVAVESGSVTTSGYTGGATEPTPVPTEPAKTTITAGTVSAEASGEVIVPITLSGNTGICGATVTVAYDEKLTLLSIERGSALSSLNMTTPGKMTDNPVNILWDGMDEDTSDGVIAYLKFTAPAEDGIYPITLSCVDGDILDDDVAPVDVTMVSGAIKVGGKKVTVTASGKSVTLENKEETDGKIVVAYYSGNRLYALEQYEPTSSLIDLGNLNDAVTKIKVMWWEKLSSAEPIVKEETISLE